LKDDKKDATTLGQKQILVFFFFFFQQTTTEIEGKPIGTVSEIKERKRKKHRPI
jgi:hypothetical protein